MGKQIQQYGACRQVPGLIRAFLFIAAALLSNMVAAQTAVTVTVTDNLDIPQTGLNVYAFDGSTYVNKSAVTNGSGEAILTLNDGNYRFRIDKNGTQFFTNATNHCTVPGCTAVSYEIPESITVTVNGAGGPESGLNVYAFNGATYVNKSAVTNSSGEAVFTLLPGNYRFRIDKSGTQYFTDTVNHCAAPGCNAVSYDLPAPVSVNVTSSAGGVEAGLSVYAFNGATYVNKSAVTNASGTATFTLLPGNYRFRIDKNGTQYFTDTANHCAVPGCDTVSYEVPENVTVTVTSSAGGFESGLTVYAFNDSTYVNKSAVSNANGQAVLTLLPGNYRFRIDKNGTQYFTDTVNHCSTPGCNAVSYEIPESVTVTVTSSAGGFEAGLNVYAFNGSTYVNKSAVTNASGQALLTLLPGSYRFRIDKNGTQFYTDSSNHCTLPGCSAVTYEVPASVTVSVTNTAGGAESGLNVYAFDGSSYVNKSAVTNANGQAVLTLLPGNYRFRTDRGGVQYFTDTANHCAVPGCNAVSQQLPASLSAFVLDPALGACLDAAGSANNWSTPSQVTSLSCNGAGVTNLSGLQSFSNLTSLSLANNAITLLNALSSLNNLTSLDLTGNSLLECAQLGDLESLLGSGVITQPSLCLGEGELVFSILNPGKPTTNQFSFAAAATPAGDIVTSAITYNPGTDAYDGRVYLIDGSNGDQLLEIQNPAQSGSDYFGWSVAVSASGDIVVGAWNDDVNGVNAGAVTVFSGATGVLLETLANPNPSANDRFGYSIATSSNGSLIIGAYNEAGGGAVYVYDDQYNLTQTLTNGAGDANGEFGKSVSATATGDIIVGVPKQDVLVGSTTVVDAGAVNVFTAPGNSLLLNIPNPNPADFDDYGSTVAATTDDDIIVSARFLDVFAQDDGSVFVHDRVNGNLLWSVANPLADVNGQFASTLATTPQGKVVVGSVNDDHGEVNAGRLYVFEAADGSLIKIIDNPEPQTNVNFGQGLAITPAGQIAVGAFGADGGYGKLYLFTTISDGESLTLLNDQEYSSPEERACVLETAAENGWSTVEEAGEFDCQSDIDNPDPFSFTNLSDVPFDYLVTSDVITLSGFEGTLNASIKVHTRARLPELSVNGGPFTSAAQTVMADDTLQARFVTGRLANYAYITSIQVGPGVAGEGGIYSDWIATTSEEGSCVSTNSEEPELGACRGGFDSEYRVYGKSGTSDLFVIREATDGSADGVSGFYLQEAVSGPLHYSIVPEITPARAAQDGFNLSSSLSLDLQLGDYDTNRFPDLLIKGLSGLFPGVDDVIVYAGSYRNSSPIGHKEIDQDYEDFFEQLNIYFFNPLNYSEFFEITHQKVLDAISILDPLMIDLGEDQVFEVNATSGAALADIIESMIYDGPSPSPYVFMEGALRFPRDREGFDLPQFIVWSDDGITEGTISFEVFDVITQILEKIVYRTADNPDQIQYLDSDKDGVRNRYDVFPYNPFESRDSDGDGLGDNNDTDKDNDRMPDSFEIFHGFDPLNWMDAAGDADNDGFSNLEEYLAGTFAGAGSGNVLAEHTLEFLRQGNKIMVHAQRYAMLSQEISICDLEFDSQIFDSSLGVRYEFCTGEINAGTARFYAEDGNGNLNTESFFDKMFTGGSVVIDSRTDLNIDDILSELNDDKPIIDFPVVVKFYDQTNTEVDSFRLSVSVIRLIELYIESAANPGVPQTEFDNNEEITARFVINAINEESLRVSRIDLDITYKETADSSPIDYPIAPIPVDGSGEVVENMKLFELTGSVQDLGDYTITAKAVITTNEFGEEIPPREVSSKTITISIVSGAGNSTVAGFNSSYSVFKNSAGDLYIAAVDENDNSIGDFELALIQTGKSPSFQVNLYNFVPSAFTNNGPATDIIVEFGDINADGLGDMVLTNLPDGAPDGMLFAGDTELGIVYTEIDNFMVDYFRYFDAVVNAKQSGQNFLSNFINGTASFNGSFVQAPDLEQHGAMKLYADEVSCLTITAPPEGYILLEDGSWIERTFGEDTISAFFCAKAKVLSSTTDVRDLVFVRSATNNFEDYPFGIRIDFFDKNQQSITGNFTTIEKYVAVEVISRFNRVMVPTPFLDVLPGGIDTAIFGESMSLLFDGIFSNYFDTAIADAVLSILKELLVKEVFDGKLDDPTALPSWTGFPGDSASSNDTLFVLGQIYKIIAAVHQQAMDEIDFPPGTENNPHPVGNVSVNGTPSSGATVSVGNVALECGATPELDQLPPSCPIERYWDFEGLGGGNFIPGEISENYLFNEPSVYSPSCKLKVECDGITTWYSRHTKLDVREPLVFGTPNAASTEINERNMVAGDPATFYLITQNSSKFFGKDFIKSLTVENSINPVNLASFLKLGNWDPNLIEFIVEKRSRTGTLERTFRTTNQDEFELLSDIGNWEMANYRVGVKYKDRNELEDVLILVVVDQDTTQEHTDWVSMEISYLDSTNWHELIPLVYEELNSTSNLDPEFSVASGIACQTDHWNEPGSFPPGAETYHPSAIYDMRSKAASGGYGHQATYDSNRDIITDPMLGAGSADRVSPGGMSTAHAVNDVLPFIRAAQLDGNPVEAFNDFAPAFMVGKILHFGSNLEKYFELRPPVVEGSGLLSPGECQP